jgi:hypothetical protein
MNAYHLACAIEGGAVYFISVDDELLGKSDKVAGIKIWVVGANH